MSICDRTTVYLMFKSNTYKWIISVVCQHVTNVFDDAWVIISYGSVDASHERQVLLQLLTDDETQWVDDGRTVKV